MDLIFNPQQKGIAMRKFRAKRLLTLLLSIAVPCILVVCSGCDLYLSGGDWEMPGSKTYEYEIGSDGGTIEVKDYSSIDGFRIVIPEGALKKE